MNVTKAQALAWLGARDITQPQGSIGLRASSADVPCNVTTHGQAFELVFGADLDCSLSHFSNRSRSGLDVPPGPLGPSRLSNLEREVGYSDFISRCCVSLAGLPLWI
jgi:hypothetical protein